MSAAIEAPEGANLLLRPMVKSDRAFVATSWLRSYEDTSKIPKSVYSKHHSQVIDALLDSGTTLIATSPETPTVIHGFICHTGALLHYCYVASALRKGGIARWMLRSALGYLPPTVECTHRAPFATRRIIYNPYHMGFSL